MNISQVLQENTTKLSKTSQTARLDAEVLLCFTLRKKKEFLYTHPDYTLSVKELDQYQKSIKKRQNGLPVAYITGVQEFYGREFTVNKDVLIPRPETEMFIDFLIKDPVLNTQHSTIIDLGTGSGCIIITLAKELPQSTFVAVDISTEALEVAKENAKKHKVEHLISFHQGNLLEPITQSQVINNESKIIITANLPYLSPKQIKNSPSIHQEPELALVAGEDGLKYYKELFEQISNLLQLTPSSSSSTSKPGKELCVLCEIDDSQKDSIQELIKNILPNFKTEIKKDLAGHARLVVIKNKTGKNTKP